ncbi:MAG: 3-phosphoshikimate 1-carboxyvinyltransferase [Clostridia bacterium]|nr:3-phosphoshikimate 1-carboxyvinyltransferase [Clostridia bacterium]
MTVEIKKGRAKGEIKAPTSKSYAHRMLIGAALAENKSRISGIPYCDDVLATAECLRALGAKIDIVGGVAEIVGFDPRCAKPVAPLFANESGSTLRFILPLCLLSGNPVTIEGKGRLMQRPMGAYEELCKEQGILYKTGDGNISVQGVLKNEDVRLVGNVTSQYVTGMLYALPFLEGDRRIILTTEIESKPYIDMTLQVMKKFGIDVCWENSETLLSRGGCHYVGIEDEVEGDWSGAAFPIALGLFGDVRVLGLNENSLQGDRVCVEYFKALSEGTPTLSVESCPDLAPILFTVAAEKNGAVFTGTRRLRMKESDRCAVMAEELSKFGADIRIYDNHVEVIKTKLHTPEEILLGHNDHRVVMSLSVLSTLYGGAIEGAEAISKSYPDFFDDLKKLKIEFKVR